MAESSILTMLHDIHLPAPISWWPPAPGWYLLFLGGLVSIVLLIRQGRRRYVRGQNKRQALQLLRTYEQENLRKPNSQLCGMRISELLRRVALAYFPRNEVAGLQGEAWLDFLSKTSKGINFKQLHDLLVELPYQPNKNADLQPLISAARAWIKQRGKPCLNS